MSKQLIQTRSIYTFWLWTIGLYSKNTGNIKYFLKAAIRASRLNEIQNMNKLLNRSIFYIHEMGRKKSDSYQKCRIWDKQKISAKTPNLSQVSESGISNCCFCTDYVF